MHTEEKSSQAQTLTHMTLSTFHILHTKNTSLPEEVEERGGVVSNEGSVAEDERAETEQDGESEDSDISEADSRGKPEFRHCNRETQGKLPARYKDDYIM